VTRQPRTQHDAQVRRARLDAETAHRHAVLFLPHDAQIARRQARQLEAPVGARADIGADRPGRAHVSTSTRSSGLPSGSTTTPAMVSPSSATSFRSFVPDATLLAALQRRVRVRAARHLDAPLRARAERRS